jgi:hypothetical protein
MRGLVVPQRNFFSCCFYSVSLGEHHRFGVGRRRNKNEHYVKTIVLSLRNLTLLPPRLVVYSFFATNNRAAALRSIACSSAPTFFALDLRRLADLLAVHGFQLSHKLVGLCPRQMREVIYGIHYCRLDREAVAIPLGRHIRVPGNT